MNTAVHPAQGAQGRHLASLSELRAHFSDACKHEAYARWLEDFGISRRHFAALTSHPRLIYAEQPGCWFYPDDVLRARLLDALCETGEIHPASGVQSLCLDAFSDRGVKAWFCTFRLHSDIEPVHLLGSTYRRRHRHRTYAALPVDGAAHERLSHVFTTSADMLEAARISPRAFADEMLARFQDGLPAGLRPMFPEGDRRSLLRFAGTLRRCDLDSALRTIAATCCELRRGVSWADYWNAVNSQHFGRKIEPLGRLYNRFLLTIEDPLRLAHALAAELDQVGGRKPGRDVSVAAIVTDDEKYRMVFFDAEREIFYYRDGGVRHELPWSRIHELASRGRTGGPCGVLAYLMMAAAGIYLVSDSVDGTSPFETAARDIHLRRIGLRFPSLAPHASQPMNRGGLLQIFTPRFETTCRRTIERFLA